MSSVASPARSVAEAAKWSRTIDYLLLFILFFVFLSGYHIHFMFTAGDWDFWVDWKDRRLWVTVTPIMAITFCSAAQYMLWEKFRLPVGATLVILGLLFGEWVSRYFNFWGWTYFPVNMVWPTSLVPSAIVLDVILLLSRSYLLTALIGGLIFSLLMYPTNWPHLAPFHVPVEYHGNVMSVADIIGYHYVRTSTPEYIRMVEKGTLRTFGKDVAPVSAFFSGFVCILIYFWWHFVGRWFSMTSMLEQPKPPPAVYDSPTVVIEYLDEAHTLASRWRPKWKRKTVRLQRELKTEREAHLLAERAAHVEEELRRQIEALQAQLVELAGERKAEEEEAKPKRPQEVVLPPVPEAERRISAWISERPEGLKKPLQAGEAYILNFKVGQPVQASLISGPETVVPSSDVPPEGLLTEWVVTSIAVELAAVTADTSVATIPVDDSTVWTGRFSLLIPKEGDSTVPQLRITPRAAKNARLDVIIYAWREIYRQFTVQLVVEEPLQISESIEAEAVTIHNDLLHAPTAHLNLRATHEWTTPPGELSIAVGQPLAYVRGDAGPVPVNQWTKWLGVEADVAGPIKNVRATTERFRAHWGDYLNEIDPDDLTKRLQQWTPDYNWASLGDYADVDHQQIWKTVQVSQELQKLAADGHSLYEAFFPIGSELRKWIDNLSLGHRLNITWLKTNSSSWIPHVPWGLMYLLDPPAPGDSVDPMSFLALRFRIEYTAHEIQVPSKALGQLVGTYRSYFLYWGDQPQDETTVESRWQRQQWAVWPNQVFVPTSLGAGAKAELTRLLYDPEPNPMIVLYLFCRCTVGEGNDPVLQFGSTLQIGDVLERTELGTKFLADQPLVFANACTTAATDPYIANELERRLFNRGCRAYLGTESNVPIQLASRFASIFFRFFYRQMDPKPMEAGEAVAQARLFLWTRYRNIGGILYTYVNQYQLYMAQDQEVRALH